MATIQIPVRSDLPAYRFSIDLEGIIYILDFGFNERSSLWYMSIYSNADELILGDLPILTNVPMTDQFVKAGLPKGRFIPINELNWGENAGRDNFGSDVKLLYRDSTDE